MMHILRGWDIAMVATAAIRCCGWPVENHDVTRDMVVSFFAWTRSSGWSSKRQTSLWKPCQSENIHHVSLIFMYVYLYFVLDIVLGGERNTQTVGC